MVLMPSQEEQHHAEVQSCKHSPRTLPLRLSTESVQMNEQGRVVLSHVLRMVRKLLLCRQNTHDLYSQVKLVCKAVTKRLHDKSGQQDSVVQHSHLISLMKCF
uniref:Uncharacterized protein n=1 Tax=Lygus hesperus TaxID=30085 RepID=A0A0A9XNA2_LYGHE